MPPRSKRPFAILLAAVALTTFGVAQATAGSADSANPARPHRPHVHRGDVGPHKGLVDPSKFFIRSAAQVNLDDETVRLPLHRGTFNGTTVWFIITEASDFGLAHDLNVNFAPKLANLAINCAACVQDVTITVPPGLKFGDAIVNFVGAPDFSPTRVLQPGPTGGAPPAVAQPGAVGDARYSPFIRIEGSQVIYNAPIVATGDGPFDVTHHTDTGDRVLRVTPAENVGPGRFSQATADLLFVRGFDAGEVITYLSTEASAPDAATLERATFVPLLNSSAFQGGDDTLGSGRERIFIFDNGQAGADNRESQGIDHLVRDGHASEDASIDNRPLIDSLRKGGDLLNVLGDIPSLEDPRKANAYSPLWDAQVGEWTPKAVSKGLNKRQVDENELLNLVATRQDLLTGRGGAPYGSTGFIINCPIVAFLDEVPAEPLAAPFPGSQQTP